MQVFVEHHARRLARRRFGDLDEHAQRFALVLLRRHRQLAVARVARDRQDRRDETHIGERAAVVADDQRLELVERRIGGLAARELERALEVVDGRPERAVHVVRRALQAQRARALAFEALAQRAERAALADAGLAREQHHLALAVLRERPALEQQADLLLAADERGQALLRGRLEPARGLADTDDAVRTRRLRDALELRLAEVNVVEAAAREAPHALAHDDVVGRRDALQPRREVHRLAERTFLGRRHDDQAGRDADAHLQRAGFGQVEPADRLDDLEPGANRAFGLALVRERVAEERDHAVAEALEKVALVAGDAHRAGVFVAADHALQHLGVDAAGELGEADHVAKEHRELATFALEPTGVGGLRRGRRGHRRQRGSTRRSEGPQKFLAVPEQHAEVLQIGLGEQAQRFEIDTVLREDRRVVAEAERLEPG